MSLLTWNINGWKAKCHDLRVWFVHNPLAFEAVALIETHMADDSVRLAGLYKIGEARAIGRSGGVSMFCRDRKAWKFVSVWRNRGVCAINVALELMWFAIYGAFDKDLNDELRDWIKVHLSDWSGRAVISGDFNRFAWEEEGWEDGYLVGGFGGPETFARGSSSSRLDYVMVRGVRGVTLHMDFPVEGTKRIADHKPILWNCMELDRDKRWTFPNWVLEMNCTRELIRNEIARCAAKGWLSVASRLRKRLPRIINHAVVTAPEEYNRVISLERRRWQRYVWEPGANPRITARVQSVLRSTQSKSGSLDSQSILSFYKNLYEGGEQAEILDANVPFSITLKEVHDAIKKMKRGKMPGPSGFTAEFFQAFAVELAPILLVEYNRMLKEEFEVRWKQGIITLLPKKGNLADVTNWRPITLLNIEWKIFTAILKTKMEEMWQNEVGEMQIGFRKGRWIQENHLLLQAILQRHRDKVQSLLFVDFEKAYDSLSHKYAVSCLASLGGVWWGQMTRKILGGSSKIWFGGKWVGTVRIERGVRQGDVVSPLLFNLCLSNLLAKLDEKLSGIALGSRRVTHTAFADDVMIILVCQADRKNVEVMAEEWRRESGMTISRKKTVELVLTADEIRSPWQRVEEVTYLGVPFDVWGNVVWKVVLNRLYSRLEACRRVCDGQVSLRQRVETVNAYALSLLPFFLKVDGDLADFEAEMRSRIKGALGNRGHVSWKRLVAPVELGGFGLVDPTELNVRMKLSWRTYLWRVSTGMSCFAAEMDRWSSAAREKAGTFVGPLLSWNSLEYYVDQWKSLARCMDGVYMRSGRLVGTDTYLWSFTDRKGDATQITKVSTDYRRCWDVNGCVWDVSGVLREGGEVERLREVVRMDRGRDILRNTGRRVWKPNLDAPANVPAQNRWLSKGFNWRRVWTLVVHSNQLPRKWIYWWMGLVHVNLPVLYKRERCCVCGGFIGSGHFIFECADMDTVVRRVRKSVGGVVCRVMSSLCLWKLHCARKHGRSGNIEAQVKKCVSSWRRWKACVK